MTRKLKGYDYGPVAFGSSKRNASDYARSLRQQGYKTKIVGRRFYDVEGDYEKTIYLVYYGKTRNQATRHPFDRLRIF